MNQLFVQACVSYGSDVLVKVSRHVLKCETKKRKPILQLEANDHDQRHSLYCCGDLCLGRS